MKQDILRAIFQHRNDASQINQDFSVELALFHTLQNCACYSFIDMVVLFGLCVYFTCIRAHKQKHARMDALGSVGVICGDLQ